MREKCNFSASSDAIMSIDIFTKNKSYDDFVNDDLLFSAVARKFEIIGEAANRIPKAFQENTPKFPGMKS